jgi:hypothetical protein
MSFAWMGKNAATHLRAAAVTWSRMLLSRISLYKDLLCELGFHRRRVLHHQGNRKAIIMQSYLQVLTSVDWAQCSVSPPRTCSLHLR